MKQVVRILFVCLVLIVVGCATQPQVADEEAPKNPIDEEKVMTDYEKEKAACEDQGGKLIGCLTTSGNACSLPTSDGGKPCKSSSECEQECVAPPNCDSGQGAESVVGTCAERTGLVCNGVETVEDGRCGSMMIA